MTVKRINDTFSRLAMENKTALVSYVMSHDPDYAGSLTIMKGLAESGADIIELGMAFSDPMADGPTIQEAAIRALDAGATIKSTLQIVRDFRQLNDTIPIILMGYYNPVLHYGVEAFAKDAVDAGVDGVIIVDLTPEEENEFIIHSEKVDLAHIKLTAPTTTKERAEKVLKHASGFVYYISVAGITGGKSATPEEVKSKLEELRTISNLPFVVGFGIKTPEQAATFKDISEGVVIGSAFVNKIKDHGNDTESAVTEIASLASNISRVLKN